VINIRYFGGKSKIAKDISQYINKVIEGGNLCSISEENQKLHNMSQNILIPHTHTHTHTHTLCRTFLWSM